MQAYPCRSFSMSLLLSWTKRRNIFLQFQILQEIVHGGLQEISSWHISPLLRRLYFRLFFYFTSLQLKPQLLQILRLGLLSSPSHQLLPKYFLFRLQFYPPLDNWRDFRSCSIRSCKKNFYQGLIRHIALICHLTQGIQKGF